MNVCALTQRKNRLLIEFHVTCAKKELPAKNDEINRKIVHINTHTQAAQSSVTRTFYFYDIILVFKTQQQ